MENTNISLWANNPYGDGIVFTFKEGDQQLGRTPLIYVQSSRDRTYTIQDGDDLWAISYGAYGESKWYWVLQEVNAYLCAEDIQTNDTIIIPDLDFLFTNQPTTSAAN